MQHPLSVVLASSLAGAPDWLPAPSRRRPSNEAWQANFASRVALTIFSSALSKAGCREGG